MSKINIFLSWSGKRSQALAEYLSRWLQQVIQLSNPWMSSNDIEKGKRWSSEIGESLQKHDIGIICVTPENYKASWLLFEAGALSKALGSSKVCPVLLGMYPSEVSGPLTQFQSTVLEKEDVLKLLQALNVELGEIAIPKEILHDAFEKNWPALEAKVQEISSIEIPGTRSKVASVIKAFAAYGLPNPVMGSQAYFKSGFESHGLYTTLTDIASERLFIFGRKNRKLFDKEHWEFFKEMKKKKECGFDFRVLFLSPDSPDWVIDCAHQDNDLREQIGECLSKAKRVLKGAGLDPSEHIRLYNIQRTVTCMIADDAVIYSPVTLDHNGRAKKLTKAPFSVLNSNADFGRELVDSFESHWTSATPLI